MPRVKKTIEETYVKKDQKEHILDLPDTYIGSVEKTQIDDIWVWEDGMVKKTINVVPGLYKIFDEILVNAIDQSVRIRGSDMPVTQIKVDIDEETGTISIYNSGQGIDVAIHQEHQIYVPELIFGHLLTSANYDKNEKKIVSGRNGYGGKLTNLFSLEFLVETVDSTRSKKFKQLFKNNMSEKTKAKVTNFKGKPFTQITFKPDFARFGMTGLEPDIVALMKRRVYDACACTDDKVTVFLNGEKLKIKKFEKYVDLYIGNKADTKRVYEKVNDRWEIVGCMSADNNLEQISFVNGIATINGGRHVRHVTENIAKRIAEKKKGLKWTHIRDNMWIFIKSSIVNPSFTSQTKEELTTPVSKFGSKCEVSTKFITAMMKTGIVERAQRLSDFKESINMKKTDGKKTSRVTGIPKLEDAEWAGTKKSGQCMLLLTEGDSAKGFCMSGLRIVGRKQYGVFPLKGKLLNVRDCSAQALAKNEEIQNLKKIIGLKQGEGYSDLSRLRYGKVCVVADQDHDGTHIKGLLINMFDSLWPELLPLGFVCSMITPIVKCTKKKKSVVFYTLQEFEEWMENHADENWTVKYLKGLGSSSPKDACSYFERFNDSLKNYTCNAGYRGTLKLAFDKELADDRKNWLSGYDRNSIVNNEETDVSIDDFVNKDLIHFSVYDNQRSIPSLYDGLKPSQRKILYTMMKKNIQKSVTVASLSGFVKAMTDYHHGEKSLEDTTVGMAQDFVGSNNLNFLYPDGQFGNRVEGGKNAASARYVSTFLNKITPLIFNPVDLNLLEYNQDDSGNQIEPRYYVPSLPTLLCNGTRGIGTGYSTFVPCYNPIKLIENLLRLMRDEDVIEMTPWYRGFKGTIEKTEKGYACRGIYSQNGKIVTITELPVGSWSQNYKEFLEKKLIGGSGPKSSQFVKSYESNCDDINVKFKVVLGKQVTDIEKKLKLIDSGIKVSNMHLFDQNDIIRKYDSVEEILREYYAVRLDLYVKRREYLLEKLQREVDLNLAKVRFIEDYLADRIKLKEWEVEQVENHLTENNYPRFEDSFDYLLNMRLRTLTPREVERLRNHADMKLAELHELENKTEKDLWCEDLDKIRKEYQKMMSEWIADNS